MEDINTLSSTTATIEKKVIRPRLVIQSLAFTGILYFCVGVTPPNPTGAIYQSVETRTRLSPTVENSVLQHAAQQSGLPTSALRIIHAQPQTWADNCLGLRVAEVFCTQIPVPGWQVAVASEKQRWIYRTDASGSVIKVELHTSVPRQEKEVASATGDLRSQIPLLSQSFIAQI